MKKNKAFTLIELLAVIVILAIIALITTPIITDVIENSRKDVFLRSTERVVEATRLDIVDKLITTSYTYTLTDGVIENSAENINVSNTQGMNGIIRYNSSGMASYAIYNDKWCVIKENNNKANITKYEEVCVLSAN